MNRPMRLRDVKDSYARIIYERMGGKMYETLDYIQARANRKYYNSLQVWFNKSARNFEDCQ